MSKSTTAEKKRNARTARRQKQTRDEIVDAARDIILRDGGQGFSIAAVAEELGLTKPAIYYYFDSKEALVFEFILREWTEAATLVQSAVARTTNGPDAVEALMRTLFERYRDKLLLFMFCHRMAPMGELAGLIGPNELERVRPINDMLYAGAESLLLADQRSGKWAKERNARRLVFTAHTAVIGLLNMMALVSASNDPLIHADDDLIDEICQTYRSTLQCTGAQ